MKFKKGDKVIYKGTKEGKSGDDWKCYFGQYGVKKGTRGVISSIANGRDMFVNDSIRGNNNSGYLRECDLILDKGKCKAVPEDHRGFMVYGTGCDNKSKIIKTEPMAKKFAKECLNDSSWTGDILIYELVPKFKCKTRATFEKIKKSRAKR